MPNNQTPVNQDLDETLNTPNNRNIGNFFESNTFHTNSVNVDEGISLVMAI